MGCLPGQIDEERQWEGERDIDGGRRREKKRAEVIAYKSTSENGFFNKFVYVGFDFD